jgi:hypothetical protein
MPRVTEHTSRRSRSSRPSPGAIRRGAGPPQLRILWAPSSRDASDLDGRFDGALFMVIREARDADLDGVLRIERLAFGREDEANLVADLLRDSTARPLLSLLAERDGRCVGHVLFTAIELVGATTPVACSILAPLAVLPEVQGTGGRARAHRSGLSDPRGARGLARLRVRGSELLRQVRIRGGNSARARGAVCDRAGGGVAGSGTRGGGRRAGSREGAAGGGARGRDALAGVGRAGESARSRVGLLDDPGDRIRLGPVSAGSGTQRWNPVLISGRSRSIGREAGAGPG